MRPVRPVFTAFMEDLALPSSVLGPVLCWALARLALRRASDMVSGVLVQVVPRNGAASVGACCASVKAAWLADAADVKADAKAG